MGGRHVKTLVAIDQLGRLLRERGELEEAERLLTEAVVGRRATLGDRHPDTLESIQALGAVARDQASADRSARREANRKAMREAARIEPEPEPSADVLS